MEKEDNYVTTIVQPSFLSNSKTFLLKNHPRILAHEPVLNCVFVWASLIQPILDLKRAFGQALKIKHLRLKISSNQRKKLLFIQMQKSQRRVKAEQQKFHLSFYMTSHCTKFYTRPCDELPEQNLNEIQSQL